MLVQKNPKTETETNMHGWFPVCSVICGFGIFLRSIVTYGSFTGTPLRAFSYQEGKPLISGNIFLYSAVARAIPEKKTVFSENPFIRTISSNEDK